MLYPHSKSLVHMDAIQDHLFQVVLMTFVLSIISARLSYMFLKQVFVVFPAYVKNTSPLNIVKDIVIMVKNCIVKTLVICIIVILANTVKPGCMHRIAKIIDPQDRAAKTYGTRTLYKLLDTRLDFTLLAPVSYQILDGIGVVELGIAAICLLGGFAYFMPRLGFGKGSGRVMSRSIFSGFSLGLGNTLLNDLSSGTEVSRPTPKTKSQKRNARRRANRKPIPKAPRIPSPPIKESVADSDDDYKADNEGSPSSATKSISKRTDYTKYSLMRRTLRRGTPPTKNIKSIPSPLVKKEQSPRPNFPKLMSFRATSIDHQGEQSAPSPSSEKEPSQVAASSPKKSMLSLPSPTIDQSPDNDLPAYESEESMASMELTQIYGGIIQVPILPPRQIVEPTPAPKSPSRSFIVASRACPDEEVPEDISDEHSKMLADLGDLDEEPSRLPSLPSYEEAMASIISTHNRTADTFLSSEIVPRTDLPPPPPEMAPQETKVEERDVKTDEPEAEIPIILVEGEQVDVSVLAEELEEKVEPQPASPKKVDKGKAKEVITPNNSGFLSINYESPFNPPKISTPSKPKKVASPDTPTTSQEELFPLPVTPIRRSRYDLYAAYPRDLELPAWALVENSPCTVRSPEIYIPDDLPDLPPTPPLSDDEDYAAFMARA